MQPLPTTYVLPISVAADAPADPDLDGYLWELVGWVDEVIVVDGSGPVRFADHGRRWPPAIRHAQPAERTPMGKVGGVLTGIRLAGRDVVVIADDDVRWRVDELADAVARMEGCDVLRPQNAFAPRPWHARWDAGRTLLHRALGGDWPGTLVLRRRALPSTGYDGAALFENLELVRTVRAAGGVACLALDLVVTRRPPTTRHFLGQRARQAYDEWARPWRLAAELAVLPGVLLGRRRAVVGIVAGSVAVAELARRRAGGTAVWPWTASLWAPAWVAERALTSWIALGSRVRGGARYRGGRLPLAANSVRTIRRRLAAEADRVGP